MDFWRTVLVLFRRWYVALPAFVLALAAAAGVYASIPTRYVSRAVLVLTMPTTGPTLPGNPREPNLITNPLLNFDRGLSMSASILIESLSTPELAAELGSPPGSDTTFQVTNGSTNPELLVNGPFVFIESESRSEPEARAVVVRVLERAKTELANRQKELAAPPSTYIAINEAVPPMIPQAQRSGKMRAAAAAVGLGLIASLCAAYSAESYLVSRRRP